MRAGLLAILSFAAGFLVAWLVEDNPMPEPTETPLLDACDRSEELLQEIEATLRTWAIPVLVEGDRAIVARPERPPPPPIVHRDAVTGLTAEQAQELAQAIEEEVYGPDALSAHESYLRSAQYRAKVAAMVGEEELALIESRLWDQYEIQYGKDILRYAAGDRFNQRLFGLLCYPCQERNP